MLTACDVLDSYSYADGRKSSTKSGAYAPTGTLPLLQITTDDGKGITSKTTWKSATLSLADSTTTGVKVKGRGNSTWGYPKKPYSLKLPSAQPLLGMKISSGWNLIANYLDVTDMRNSLTYALSELTSLSWTPSGRFVEVELNGLYMGLFWLCEKVEVAPERLQAQWLVCFDDHFDETYRFRTDYKKLPVGIETEEGTSIDAEFFNEIRSALNAAETALYKGGDWQSLLDTDSFCDWYLLQEISDNQEGAGPKSVYMHMGLDGKIHAGPAWDYDYATYSNDVRKLVASGDVWYDALMKDKDFVARLKERKDELFPAFREFVPKYINQTSELIERSAEQDNEMWPTLRTVNDDAALPFEEATQLLEENVLERLDVLDALIDDLYEEL